MATASNPWDFFGLGSALRNNPSPYNIFYSPDKPTSTAATKAPPAPAAAPRRSFSGTVGRVDGNLTPAGEGVYMRNARSGAAAANGGVVPVDYQTGGADEVVGSFTGRNGTRTLTRAQAGPASDAGMARRGFAPPDDTGNASYASTNASAPDDRERQARVSDINDALWTLQHTGGGVNMRSKRELFGQLLGQKNDLTSTAFKADADRQTANAQFANEAGAQNAGLAERGAQRRGDSQQAYDALGENSRQFGINQQGENDRAQLAYKGQQASAQADLIKAAADWQRNNDNDATARVEARAQANIKDGMKADEAYTRARYDEAALQAQSGRGAASNFQSAAGQADALSTAEQASSNTGIWQYLQNVGTGRDWYLPGSQEAIAPNSLTSADQLGTTDGNWTDYLRPGTGEGIQYTDSAGRTRTSELSDYPGLVDTLRTLQTRGAPRR